MQPIILIILTTLASSKTTSNQQENLLIPCVIPTYDSLTTEEWGACDIPPLTNTPCQPQSPAEVIQNIIYYSPKKKNVTIPLWPKISSQFFDNSMPTVIIIHGWTDSGYIPWINELALAYLGRGPYNIIAPDWSRGASQTYEQSVANIVPLAKVLCRLLSHIYGLNGYSSKQITIVSHSLGAHGGALTAKAQKKNGTIIDTMIVLDAAKPLFEVLSHPNERVGPEDASFVMALHTNTIFQGYGPPYAQADIYIDLGYVVSNCLTSKDATLEVLAYQKKGVASCSHQFSHVLWIQNIKNPYCSLAQSFDSIFSGDQDITLGAFDIHQTPNVASCPKDTCFPLGIESYHYHPRGIYVTYTTLKEPYCNNSTRANNRSWTPALHFFG